MTGVGALERVREQAPAVHDRMTRAYELAWSSKVPDILELARLRIAMMLGCEAEFATRTDGIEVDERKVRELGAWRDSPLFTPAERACLALVEQFVVYVPGVTDEMTAAVLEHLDAKQLYSFVTALYVFDTRARLQIAVDRVFEAS